MIFNQTLINVAEVLIKLPHSKVYQELLQFFKDNFLFEKKKKILNEKIIKRNKRNSKNIKFIYLLIT